MYSNRLPHMHRSILARRSNMLPIGRPCYGPDNILVLAVGKRGLLRIRTFLKHRIPHLDGVIIAAGGEMFAIGRPRYRLYLTGMTSIGNKLSVGHGILVLCPVV